MPQHSPQYFSREREIIERRERERERDLQEQELREREIRERSNLEYRRQQEEMMAREREAREREQMERFNREQEQQRPVQSHAGSTPLHQPVANRVQNSIHGPNGLLSNGGAGPPQQNGPVSSNPTSIFNTAPPSSETRPQFIHQQPPQPVQQPAPAFMAGPSPMPSQAQLSQGQQPILNVSN